MGPPIFLFKCCLRDAGKINNEVDFGGKEEKWEKL